MTELTAVEQRNQTLLDDYKAYMATQGRAAKTIKAHIGSLEFFSDYLCYYEESRDNDLTTATAVDVDAFMGDWFPRKALWACKTEVNLYCAVFKKFYQWLVQIHDFPADEYDDIVSSIKEGKSFWVESVAMDEDY